MTDRMLIISIAVIALITIALRAFPFILLKGRNTPEWVNYLGRVLSYAVMGLLVVYCLKSVSFSSPRGFVPELIAGVVVAASYVWKRNTLLSIISGTILYMIMVQMIF